MADYKIKWNGLVDDSESDSLVSADNNEVPTSVDLGTWGGYVPVWFKSGCYTGVFPFGFTRGFCEIGVMDPGSGTVNLCKFPTTNSNQAKTTTGTP